jgi:DNA invertase Pin-like site-specific DNA recombinase
MPKPVITYARYSPTGRKKVESIEHQRAKMSAWCEAFDRPLVGEYADRDTSGKDDARTGLTAALKHVCRIRGLLLVHKLDRLTRKLSDALALLEQLRQSQADLAIVTWNVDTSTHTGRLLFNLLAAA